MIILFAVDPGKKGAFAYSYFDPSNRTFDNQPVDITARSWAGEHDAAGTLADLALLYHVEVIIEKVHSSPQSGPRSSFTFGENFGMWQGIFAALRQPYRMVAPQQWQRGIPNLSGKKDDERKNALKAEAQRRYPNLKVTLKTADAILLHDYLKQQKLKK